MTAFDNPNFDDHEEVHHFFDPVTSTRAVIAIHSTVLGPAAGGCRLWHYASADEAVTDALRLSRGMTYKNAMAGLPFGGGKAVLLASEDRKKSPALFEFFGQCVESLGGKYVTAEDVGVSTEDMRCVSRVTNFVSGLPSSVGQVGGDPSPWTAKGVFLSIQAAVHHLRGQESLQGVRVAVQGAGNVGRHLCKLLADAGASVTIADINADNVSRLLKVVDAKVVDPADLLTEDVDVLSPCALGAVLDSESIPNIKAPIIAGGANNQLGSEQDGSSLLDRGIVYVPDYVANAGGIISVAGEYLGNTDIRSITTAVEQIPQRVASVLDTAKRENRPSNQVADEMARQIIAHEAGLANTEMALGRQVS